MSETGRAGDPRGEAAGKMESCGYVETDPTGRYGRFKEVLGKGATKTVYKAFDEMLGMEVAWNQAKVNDVCRTPEELQRLYSEVQLLSILKHDSLIRFYTSWIDVDKRTFNFITEMFTSGTLREYRKKYRRVDTRAVKNWARQILKGLVHLHEHDPPVIHRDLKCDNIFVNGHLGQVKIGDLGLAAILRSSHSAHSVIGTPEFMAPELYEEEYNELVDVYSFGMCMIEMLTSELPYSECCNPAQIYKKVTTGKLPEAFYRIQDREAQTFVGKCLQNVTNRLSAKELLVDPFLYLNNNELAPIIPRTIHGTDIDDDEVDREHHLRRRLAGRTDMTIAGTMNPEDDTIFLKVQIADENGNVRHIHFPFDIHKDTAIDVATEMVKELEIVDIGAEEIAEVIDEEITALVPHWKWDMRRLQHSFNIRDDDDEYDGGPHHYPPSSPSSSHASFASLLPATEPHPPNMDALLSFHSDWFQGDLVADGDTSSQSSLCYSNMNYSSSNEMDNEQLSPRKEPTSHTLQSKSSKSTRFCPDEHLEAGTTSSTGRTYNPENSPGRTSRGGRRSVADRCLSRIRSFVDIRSQLLHRSLVEEMNRRRMFKTVGAVENIGFQAPCEVLAKPGKHGYKKNHGLKR